MQADYAILCPMQEELEATLRAIKTIKAPKIEINGKKLDDIVLLNCFKYPNSEDGRVRSIGRVVKNKCGTMTVNERILKPWIDTWGYKNVCLYNDGKCQSKKVHRLIADGHSVKK